MLWVLVPLLLESSLCKKKLLPKLTMYQRKVDVGMRNTVKSVLADVSSISPSSLLWQTANTWNVSQHTLYGIQHIHINLTLIQCTFTATPMQTKLVLTGTSIPNYWPGQLEFLSALYSVVSTLCFAGVGHFWNLPQCSLVFSRPDYNMIKAS